MCFVFFFNFCAGSMTKFHHSYSNWWEVENVAPEYYYLISFLFLISDILPCAKHFAFYKILPSDVSVVPSSTWIQKHAAHTASSSSPSPIPIPVLLGSSVPSYSSSFGSCTCDLSIWRKGEELVLEIQELYSKNDICMPQRMYDSNGVEILASEPLKSWQNNDHRHPPLDICWCWEPIQGLWAHRGDSMETRPRAGVAWVSPGTSA